MVGHSCCEIMLLGIVYVLGANWEMDEDSPLLSALLSVLRMSNCFRPCGLLGRVPSHLFWVAMRKCT